MSKSDDTISRQAAINTVHEMRKKCDTDSIDDYEEMLTVALEELCPVQPDLEELDFVQPHPKSSVTLEILSQPQRTGHWIPMTYRYVPSEEPPYTVIKWMEATEPDDIEGLKCSECGEIYDFTEARNWCSECGARMRYKDATI